MPLISLSQSSSTPAPQYLSVVPSDRALVEKHSPGALAPSQELKFKTHIGNNVEDYNNLLVPPALPVSFSDSAIFTSAQGTGASERVGRTTTLHMWTVRLLLSCRYYQNIAPEVTQQCFPPSYRVVMGIDHQPIADVYTIPMGDLFDTAGFQNPAHLAYLYPFNPVNEQRFTILYDNCGVIETRNAIDSFNGGTDEASQCLSKQLEFKTVLKVKADYPDGQIASNTERPFIFVIMPQHGDTPAPSGTTYKTACQAIHQFRYTD